MEWDPGRYLGVTALQPVPGGFNDHKTLMDSGDYNGRFYEAHVEDVDHDGTFEIVETPNDCDPPVPRAPSAAWCGAGTATTT